MTFKEKLNTGKFVITSEIGPPKGISLAKIIDEMMSVRNRIDAVNVTDLQSSVMRMSSLGASILLKQAGFETIFQMTCRDRNRLALQADMLSAAAFGIENILALTGDHPVLGDHPQAKAVFDIDSVHLVEIVRKLEGGVDMNGNKLVGSAPNFFIGAAVNPGADPLEPEIIKMEKKIEAGAEFFQTQAIFDIRVFENFLNKTKHLKTKILAGVVVLKSERTALYMNEHVPGVSVPQDIIDAIAQAQDKMQKSVEISASLINELKKMSDGVHIMPIGFYKAVSPILDAIGA